MAPAPSPPARVTGAAPTAPPGPEARGVETLPGVGPRQAARLASLGLRTVQDLLFHLPLRYQDRTHITPIGATEPGHEAVICGQVELAQVRMGRRRSLLVAVADGSGTLLLRFFHFNRTQQEGFRRGERIFCYGEIRRGPSGPEMVHPEYKLLGPVAEPPLSARLTPIYPTTEGVSQAALRRLTGEALDTLRHGRGPTEHLPASVRARLDLPALTDALWAVHRPAATGGDGGAASVRAAVRRLAFEELLAQHLSLRRLRARYEHERAPELVTGGQLRARFEASLPFRLTAAQRRVSEEIGADLGHHRPMHRLAQGDVGAGKTVVAALAALQAIEAGFQVALMAPTELLAEQHLTTFRGWLEPLEVEVGWLSGKLGARERRAALARIASGDTALVVGTHALFQDDVTFRALGLVVIDEQHRFGVHQRLALRGKGVADGRHPHQLIMTATPIPRTLAMTAYADLDTSVIDELPPGRSPVETAVVPSTRRDEVVERVHAACREGQQAYWVCTLIEESDALEAQAAEDTANHLAEALPDLAVGLVHGRMKLAERDTVMQRFKAGDLHLLVATTVIEVGVDVPNASLMIIENAERLGLSQLHQLRGRVGRGARKSVCVMLFHGPLSRNARARLDVLRETTDGFLIAERDLELRGPGEVLGTRQTGVLQLRIADLARDRELLAMVERAGREILEQHPSSVEPLIRRWLGEAVEYARA
ncbi:MAG: ATP-dependent DNA helicase RecG [Ectothiorhodospiraceae bacterium]|nr:ATP-dependent DNA helicase RecG [Chromatiales bacterium]MCP5153572.1 ATP-dependent DNA helicase RecG [Ectothiorhodospiraceae bacterium]